ncbi:MAG: hypothetical protein HY725_18975, partial [Candidatus Rokubacteria bacterium]|nr:hypothetical protein [Candidatus Rokubacteria bacterium]
MNIFLSAPDSWRRLGTAVAVSLLIHAGLFALGLLLTEFGPIVVVKKGEPLFVELAKPEEEPAPRGNPALVPGPRARPSRPPAPKSPPPVAKAAPKVETALPAPKAETPPAAPT